MTVVLPVPGGPRMSDISGHVRPVVTAFRCVSTPLQSEVVILDLKFNPGFNKVTPESD